VQANNAIGHLTDHMLNYNPAEKFTQPKALRTLDDFQTCDDSFKGSTVCAHRAIAMVEVGWITDIAPL